MTQSHNLSHSRAAAHSFRKSGMSMLSASNGKECAFAARTGSKLETVLIAPTVSGRDPTSVQLEGIGKDWLLKSAWTLWITQNYPEMAAFGM